MDATNARRRPQPFLRPPRIISVRLAGRGPSVRVGETTSGTAHPGEAPDDAGHVLTPAIVFPEQGSTRAEARVGAVGYAFLRSLALEGVPLLASVIEGIDDRLRTLIAIPDEERTEAHGLLTYQAAIGAQWQAMAHFCIVAERLVSVVNALELFRDGDLDDPARALLEPSLNLLAVVDQKDHRRSTFWRRLGGVPDRSGLVAAGLGGRQATALDAAAERWAAEMAGRWSHLRTFHTADLHRVFLAYKHGFSFVSPRSSRLELSGLTTTERIEVEAILNRGFAVALARRDGTRWLMVIDASPDELVNAFAACSIVLTALRSVALSWVFELEHASSRSAALDVDIEDFEALPAAIEAWFGTDLDPEYRAVFRDAVDLVRKRRRSP